MTLARALQVLQHSDPSEASSGGVSMWPIGDIPGGATV
jgi:hypothetical protein